MAYLRDNRKLLIALAAHVCLLAACLLFSGLFSFSRIIDTAAVASVLIGGFVWPWVLYKPSTLRTRLRRQGPVVAYLVGLVLLVAIGNEVFGVVYVGIGFVWLIVYLFRNASGDYTYDDPYKDSRGLYGSVSPEPIFREH